MTCVSSLHKAPVNVTVPDDKAAKIRARLVMLLDPGTVMDTKAGVGGGTISMRSGSGIGSGGFLGLGIRKAEVSSRFGLAEEIFDGFLIARVQSQSEFR